VTDPIAYASEIWSLVNPDVIRASASPGRKKDHKRSADAKQIAVDTSRRCAGDYTAALEVLEINHPSTYAVPHHELQFGYLKRWAEQGISDGRSSNRSGLEVAGKVGCVLPSGLIARFAWAVLIGAHLA
jgi:hypothetical protein